MKQKLAPGAVIETVTPDEMAALLPRPELRTRIRAAASLQLDGSGNGQERVYTPPAGQKFEIRRIVLTLTGNVPSDPNTGNVLLNTAGKYIAYLRGDSLIEYGSPFYCGSYQVPGAQNWGEEQGPYIQNQEIFSVLAHGLTPSAVLNVYLEGVLTRPSTRKPE